MKVDVPSSVCFFVLLIAGYAVSYGASVMVPQLVPQLVPHLVPHLDESWVADKEFSFLDE